MIFSFIIVLISIPFWNPAIHSSESVDYCAPVSFLNHYQRLSEGLCFPKGRTCFLRHISTFSKSFLLITLPNKCLLGQLNHSFHLELILMSLLDCFPIFLCECTKSQTRNSESVHWTYFLSVMLLWIILSFLLWGSLPRLLHFLVSSQLQLKSLFCKASECHAKMCKPFSWHRNHPSPMAYGASS